MTDCLTSGNFQYLFQLMIGLDAVYYTFKEIRTPYVNEAEKDLADLTREQTGGKQFRTITTYMAAKVELVEPAFMSSLADETSPVVRGLKDV